MFKARNRSTETLFGNARWASWINRAAAGDLEALSDLYDETSTAVYSLIVHILQDPREAQETLLLVYDRAGRNASRFAQQGQTAAGWLLTTAREVALERLQRTAARSPQAVAFGPFRKASSDNPSLARLSTEQRSILHMSYFGGMTAEEIAGILGLTREHVSRQIVIGMRMLKACQRIAATG